MEKIIVKLLTNPVNPKLKMKYVGAVEYATPKLGADGKTVTGFDENALEIISIADDKERGKVQKQILADKKELEKLLGVDLAPSSSFWDKFFVALTDEEIVLDMSNPMDKVKAKFLVANRYVAPSEDDIYNDERYESCIFYMYRDVEETTKKVQKQKRKDKAKGKLSLLSEDNPNKLKTVASYLFGYNAQADMSPEKAYEKLSEFIEIANEDVQKKNIEKFLVAVDLTQEEMMTKLVFDKAIRKKIITQRNGIYRRGDKIIGNNYDEAVSNLKSVEMSGELVSLMKEVED